MRPARFAWLADRQRASRRLVLRATLVLVALGLVIPAAARADGDPASDYLYTARVFVPTGTPRAAQLQLGRVVAAANAAGESVKVAVIGSPYDLGSLTPLWQKPHVYVRFLGVELSSRFHGLLVVEMPNGFGVYRHGAPVTNELAALKGVVPGQGITGLMSSAAEAIVKIATADGHRLSVTPGPVPGPQRSPTRILGQRISRVVPAGVAAAVLALLVLGAVRLLRVNARRQTDGDDVLGLGQPPHDHIDAAVRDPGSERTAPAGRRGGSWRLRWLIGVSVVACALLAFDTAVSFGYLHWGSGPSTPAPASAAQAEGFTWPAGKTTRAVVRASRPKRPRGHPTRIRWSPHDPGVHRPSVQTILSP